LGAVSVLVENLNAAATETGLTREDLQTDVELRLRQAGVKVVDSSNPPGRLYVSVHMMRPHYANGSPTNGISMLLELELHQGVALLRDPSSVLLAPTWSVSMMASSSPGDVRTFCRNDVKDLVDKFLNAYLEQNPKR
jgi:hypothetical protein